MRDAAHSTLLRVARQQLQARIAEGLEEFLPEMIHSQPELSAQHYAEAGLNEKAVEYWTRAGKRSAARSATAEAEAQFLKALSRLELLPDGIERWQTELALQSPLCRVNAGRGAIRKSGSTPCTTTEPEQGKRIDPESVGRLLRMDAFYISGVRLEPYSYRPMIRHFAPPTPKFRVFDPILCVLGPDFSILLVQIRFRGSKR